MIAMPMLARNRNGTRNESIEIIRMMVAKMTASIT